MLGSVVITWQSQYVLGWDGHAIVTTNMAIRRIHKITPRGRLSTTAGTAIKDGGMVTVMGCSLPWFYLPTSKWMWTTATRTLLSSTRQTATFVAAWSLLA
jgi:hypothetical protein